MVVAGAPGEQILDEEVALVAAGIRRVISCSCAPVRGDEGELVAGVLVVDDVTERQAGPAHWRPIARCSLREAIMACRKGGTVSVLGVYGLTDKFPMGVVMNKGLTIRSAQQHGQHYMPRLLEWAAGGELDPSFLATHRFSLEEGAKAYDMFKHKKDGCVRAVFTP